MGCERPGTLWIACQLPGVHGTDEAARPHHGPRLAAWRPFVSWFRDPRCAASAFFPHVGESLGCKNNVFDMLPRLPLFLQAKRSAPRPCISSRYLTCTWNPRAAHHVLSQMSDAVACLRVASASVRSRACETSLLCALGAIWICIG